MKRTDVPDILGRSASVTTAMHFRYGTFGNETPCGLDIPEYESSMDIAFTI